MNAAQASSVGVAFVAAALGLGVCLGLVFPTALGAAPDLLDIARSQGRDILPEDTVEEVFGGIDAWNRPYAGEWILIYGGRVPLPSRFSGRLSNVVSASSVTAQVAIQLAQWAGLRVAAVADLTKHRARLEALGAGKCRLHHSTRSFQLTLS